MFIIIFYAAVVTLNGPVFWLSGSWRMVIGFYYIFSNLIVLAAVLIYLEDTPMDCVVYCSPLESQRMFERIAEINGTSETLGITFE